MIGPLSTVEAQIDHFFPNDSHPYRILDRRVAADSIRLTRRIMSASAMARRSSTMPGPAMAPDPNGSTFTRLRQSASRALSRESIS